MRYRSEQARLLQLNTQIIFEPLACLRPGFQRHELRRRLVEIENNSKFSHIQTYFRVLDRDDDYLDHVVMQVSLYIVPSPLSMY